MTDRIRARLAVLEAQKLHIEEDLQRLSIALAQHQAAIWELRGLMEPEPEEPGQPPEETADTRPT